jgi:DNA polymerase-1
MQKLTLIDGSGFIFRAFYALPPLSAPDGTPIGAVLGFCNILIKWQETHQPTYWAVVFDKGRSRFRQELYPEYKSHRPPADPSLTVQFDLVREVCRAFRISILEEEGVEADDLIASATHLALAEGWQVSIVSSDKDMAQLVGPHVELYDPLKQKTLDQHSVEEQWGVPVSHIPFVQALAGDTSDGIPGIPGVGMKTATAWIQKFGSLEALLAHPEQLAQPKKQELVRHYAEQARLCYQLVCLRKDFSLPFSLEECAYQQPDFKAMQAFVDRYQMQGLKQRLVRKGVLEESVASAPSYHFVRDPSFEDITRSGYISLVWDEKKAEAEGQWGAGVSWGNGNCAYVQGPLLAQLISDSSCLKIVHDCKTWIHKMGLDDDSGCVEPFDDVMILSYEIYGGHEKHDMASLIHRILNRSLDTGDEKESIAGQACLLYSVWEKLKAQLTLLSLHTVYECLDRPLVPILAQMEHRGIEINAPYLSQLSQRWLGEIQELEEKIYTLTGEKFNIASPKQVGEVLFDRLGWPGGKRGKSGAYQTSSDVLDFFAAQEYPLAQFLLQWRQLTKLRNTYTEGLIAQIQPHTGRLCTTYSMVTTSTGRLSSLSPNLQNIPIRTEQGKKIRKAFQASPPYGLLCLDYSQIELRLLAHMGKIEALQNAFHGDLDIHRQTACDIFGCDLAQVTPDMRRSAKTINFGLIYGISPFGLAQQLGVSQSEAKTLIDRYFEKYPGILDYMETSKEKARSLGYVTTLWGRRCSIPNIESRTYPLRSAAERQAINAPLQGTSADIMKKAMISIDHWIKATQRDAKVLLQVHDELILEVRQDEWQEVANGLVPLMESAASLSVPLRVNRIFGHTWGHE